MKKKLVIPIFILSLCLNITNGKAQKYTIKSGHVEYELSGNTTGTKSVWWNNYGEKTYTEINSVSVTKFMGITNREEEHSINITVGDNFWRVNLIDNTGEKGKLEYYNDAQEYADEITEAEAKQIEEQLLAALGGKRLGNESILGNSCEVIEVLGAKSWFYKGVVLKSTAKVLGIEANEIAKSFDKNCMVPSSKFVAPTNIKYIDVTAMKEAYYGGQMDDEDEEESNDDIVPLAYSYNNFLKAIAPLSDKGYIRAMTNNSDGQYIAVFMKGLVLGLTIVATSHRNMNAEGNGDFSSYEKFTHNGKVCYYGKEDGSTILAEEYKNKDMVVLFSFTVDQSKDQLLKIADSCSF